MPRSLVLSLLVVGVTVAAPVPKGKPKEPSLDGRWITTERSHSGGPITQPWVWVIDGESFTAHAAKDGGAGTPSFPNATTTLTRPDPTRADEYDYTYKAANTTLVYRGRVNWDGGDWVFAFGSANGDRPAEAKAGNGVYFHRFTRIADK